ncbi:MAG: ArsR/SmtB family transcription factor [Candidatus Helarchaeota archaeon]
MSEESKTLEIDFYNSESSIFFNALQSETRRKILALIATTRDLTITKIASLLSQTEANISTQVQILERAGLITIHYAAGRHGISKILNRRYVQFIVRFLK